jgi:hypothetical protein
MSLDRIKQTLVVTGTGPITLTADASPGGYRPFIAAMSAGGTVTICIVDTVTNEWEVTGAIFQLGGVGGTLTRSATAASSNLNNPVNFRGNPCDVFATYSAVTDATAAALISALSGLPTTEPPGGGPWLNSGVVCVAQGGG